MKTFSIDTLGCKVNQYESQQIRELLEGLGLKQVETSNNAADLVVVNTCCVTQTASAKSRQYVRKARKLNPDAVIVVCGCLPAVQIGELGNLGKNIHFVKYRDTLGATLSQLVKGQNVTQGSKESKTSENTFIRTENALGIKCKNELSYQVKPSGLTQVKLPGLTSFKGHTRAFLKVQDGCDGYCSYCIIPKVRPVVQNRPVEELLDEAQTLVKSGHKEIVVTGVFLGAYGQSSVRRNAWPNGQNEKLADLVEKLAQVPALARLRLSSLEPADVTPRLLDVFCKYRNIMPHLHLSLQSGSNAVLKRMARQYRIEDFVESVEKIKLRLDRPAITGDLIVGFPGETDADFGRTVDLVKAVGFAKMHVFGFSARKPTAAAQMQPVVNNEVIKDRSRVLRRLDADLGRKFREQFLGETAMVLIENVNGEVSGRSERYFVVSVEKAEENVRKSEILKVRLVQNGRNGVVGRCE